MRRNEEESSSSTPVRHAPLPSSGEERKYKGVRRRKWGRWVSEIRLPNSRERIWLGSYGTPEQAARAFDAAYVCLRGPGRTDGLNFPDSPPPDVVGRTSDPQEVYAAAVSHANRADTAAAPWDGAGAATDPSSEPTQSTQEQHGGAPVETAAPVAPSPAPSLRLEVSTNDDSFDWFANPPPLYSPTMVVESHAYLPAAQKAASDVDVEENESGSCPGLWCFDSDDDEVRMHK